MKYLRRSFTILILLLLTSTVLNVSAMNTGFSTQTLSEDKTAEIIKRMNIVLLKEEPPKKAINCFDVSENGLIAVGCKGFDEKATVCIYMSDGKFQHGYSFECTGSFGVEFDNDTLLIYLVRGDIAIAVDTSGDVKEILEIQNTAENNTYWQETVNSDNRVIGESKYSLKNDFGILNFFATSYSRLTVTKENGEENIIYDVNSAQLLKVVIVFAVVLAIVCISIVVIVKEFRKQNSGK